MSDIVPRNEVSKQGVRGVGAIVSGAALIILHALAAIPVVGFVVGGALAVAGFALTGSKSERTLGFIAAGAGILTILSRIIPHLGWIMWVPGVALLAVGAVSLFRFFGNLKKRS